MRFLLITLFIFSSCTKQEGSNTPSFTRFELMQKNDLFAAAYLKKPNEIQIDEWTKNINRKVLKNQITGFILMGNLCLIKNHKAYVLIPININYPSAKDYSTGTYYDAMEELSEKNCKSSHYAFIETDKSIKVHDININIENVAIESKEPQMELFIPIEPYSFSLGLNRGTYRQEDENLSIKALKLATSHRIRPIKSWLEPYREERHEVFEQFVLDYGRFRTNIPIRGNLNKLFERENLPKSWFYVWDEPFGDEFYELKSDLRKLKRAYPNIKRMVTTNFRKDLAIDIYCPVAEHIDDESVALYKKHNKTLWMYISCMSHGCGPSREYQDDPRQIMPDYQYRSGTPDLSIEASSADIYMFYLLATKYPIEALLYYNSIEQWKLTSFNINTFKDMFNFGGNGDGTLFYPNIEKKEAMVSLRVKMLREASYFYDAVKLSKSEKIFADDIESTLKWSFDFKNIDRVFDRLTK